MQTKVKIFLYFMDFNEISSFIVSHINLLFVVFFFKSYHRIENPFCSSLSTNTRTDAHIHTRPHEEEEQEDGNDDEENKNKEERQCIEVSNMK